MFRSCLALRLGFSIGIAVQAIRFLCAMSCVKIPKANEGKITQRGKHTKCWLACFPWRLTLHWHRSATNHKHWLEPPLPTISTWQQRCQKCLICITIFFGLKQWMNLLFERWLYILSCSFPTTNVLHTTIWLRALQAKCIRTTTWGVYKVHATVTRHSPACFWDGLVHLLRKNLLQMPLSFVLRALEGFHRLKPSATGEQFSLAVRCSLAAGHLVIPEWRQKGL